MYKFRSLIIAILICGLYGVLLATVPWNGSLEVKGNLIVDGTCTGCGGAPALILLEQHSASTSNSLDFTCPSNTAYNKFEFDVVNLIPTTSSLNFSAQMGTGAGPTYDTGNNYSWLGWRNITNAQGASGNSAVGSIQWDGSGIDAVSNSTSWGITGSISLYSPASTSLFKSITGGPFHFLTGGAAREQSFSSGAYESATAVTGIRFFSGTFGTNTIASGTILCYGKIH